MAKINHSTSAGTAIISSPDFIDLDSHPDGALLRLCAGLERLRAIAEEIERIAASLPARTVLGRRMKELTL